MSSKVLVLCSYEKQFWGSCDTPFWPIRLLVTNGFGKFVITVYAIFINSTNWKLFRARNNMVGQSVLTFIYKKFVCDLWDFLNQLYPTLWWLGLRMVAKGIFHKMPSSFLCYVNCSPATIFWVFFLILSVLSLVKWWHPAPPNPSSSYRIINCNIAMQIFFFKKLKLFQDAGMYR